MRTFLMSEMTTFSLHRVGRFAAALIRRCVEDAVFEAKI